MTEIPPDLNLEGTVCLIHFFEGFVPSSECFATSAAVFLQYLSNLQ